MNAPAPSFDLGALLRELLSAPFESEWLEFKVNYWNPQDIGEYISALANSAAPLVKSHGYVVWGVEDGSRQVVGTSVNPSSEKQGNESFENWLTRLLTPQVPYRFHVGDVEGKRIVVLEIDRALHHPVRFHGEEYIRVGSHKKPLKAHPEKERALWKCFTATSFEDGLAAQRLAEADVLQVLSFTSYFDLLQIPLPPTHASIIAALESDRLVHRADDGSWSITNLGAVLFAKDLSQFDGLQRKVVRIVQYDGEGRMFTTNEQIVSSGYAAGFEALIQSIIAVLPTNEVIEQALRKAVPMFPAIVVREIVANALIHQDFSVAGSGPMIEVFADRMEVTNPGRPLGPTDRLLDQPPRSRNERLASLLRRFGICEERGSGVDKVVYHIELFQLPAPLFETPGDFLRVVLFGHRPLKKMEKTDRIRACYLHACLRYVTRQLMTNASLRERFGIDERNASLASRLLNEAVASGMILVRDPVAGTRNRTYLPFWAPPTSAGEGVA